MRLQLLKNRCTHGLFVAAQVIRGVWILLKRLSDPSNIAVAKNPKATCEKPALDSIPLDILIFQELDRSLRRRHSRRGRQIASSKGAPDPRSYRDKEHAKENAGAVFAAPPRRRVGPGNFTPSRSQIRA